MSLSRRSFVQTLGVGAAGAWIGSRGREGSLFGSDLYAQGIQPVQGPAPSVILSSNENPLGCHKDVLAGVRGSFTEAGRYPFATVDEVTELIARKHKVKKENVLLGSGSTQILRTSTHVFTSKTAGLVAAIPAYEECADYARLMGHPLTGVKLTSDLKMDLDALQTASKGAGLVFYCNPNNPVATAVSAADTRTYLASLMKASPNTTVLVDEAYFEYATNPGLRDLHSRRRREPAHRRRAHVLEVLRDGGPAHGLRDCSQGHHREDGGLGRRRRHQRDGAAGRARGAQRAGSSGSRTSRSATRRRGRSRRSGSRITATRRPTRRPTSCSSTSSGRRASSVRRA